MEKGIHEGHRQRLREYISKVGAYDLNDVNFLENLLTFVIARGDTNPIAHRLLDEFGSVDQVFDASYDSLIKVEGVGEKTARFLQTMSVTCFMYNKSKATKKRIIATRADLLDYLKAILPPTHNEQFAVIKLSRDSHVLGYKVFEGVSHSHIVFDALKLSEYLIGHKASFCVFVHTHPDGSCHPSQADIKTFHDLLALIDALRVTLVDNIILGKDGYFSTKLSRSAEYDDVIVNEPLSFVDKNEEE